MRKIALALLLALASASPVLAAPCAAIPALPDTERRTEYTGIVSQTGPFNVNFQLYGDATDYGNWLTVWVNGVQKTAGADFTVATASGPALGSTCLPITNAQVTFTAAQSGTIEIVGARRPRRASQVSENAGVSAHAFNQVISDLTATQREQWDLRTRTLLGLPGENISPLPSAATRAGKFLFFDATGLIPQFTTGGAGSGNVVGPPSSTVGHLATWANTTGTLLADGSVTQIVINASGFTLPRTTVFGEAVPLILSGAQDFHTQGENILLFEAIGAGANGTILMAKSGGGAQVTGSVSGNVLTVTAMQAITDLGATGSLAIGQIVIVSGVPTGTTITANAGSGGTPCGGLACTGNGTTGTYALSATGTVAGGTTILTNDNPQNPTATLAHQYMGFVAAQGWCNSVCNAGGVGFPANGSAFMRFTAYPAGASFTPTDWGSGIDFLTTAVGSTAAGGGGFGTPGLSIMPPPAPTAGGSPPQLAGGYLVQTLTHISDSLTSGQADGIVLQNTTAATAGVTSQVSPSAHWSSTAWNTVALATQNAEFFSTAVPASGNPITASLTFATRINGGSITRVASLTSGGLIDAATGYTVASAAGSVGWGIRSDGGKGIFGQFQFSDLGGSVACSQMPAFTGDISKIAGSCTTTVANITTGATVPGFMDWTQTSAPSNPAASHDRIFMSSVDTLKVLSSGGAVTSTVPGIAAVSHQFLTAFNVVTATWSQAQPAFSDLSGSATCSQMPALTSDVTTSAGSCTTTVANVTSGATFPGSYDWTLIAAPANPGAGKLRVFADTSGGTNLKTLNSAGLISTTVTPLGAVSHQFFTALSNTGVFSQAQPASTDLSDVTEGGSWTPSDQSGATLTFVGVSVSYSKFGNMVMVYGRLTFPATGSGAAVLIGGLPATAANQNYASAPGVCNSNGTVGLQAQPVKNTTTFIVLNSITGASITNANMSSQTLNCTFSYSTI